MGSLSIWHWLIVLVVIVLVFGTKKLKNVGSDLGAAVKGFKDGVKEGGADAAEQAGAAAGQVQSELKQTANTIKDTIDVEAKQKV